jgi:hypothetical protein
MYLACISAPRMTQSGPNVTIVRRHSTASEGCASATGGESLQHYRFRVDGVRESQDIAELRECPAGVELTCGEPPTERGQLSLMLLNISSGDCSSGLPVAASFRGGTTRSGDLSRYPTIRSHEGKHYGAMERCDPGPPDSHHLPPGDRERGGLGCAVINR